MRGLDFKNEIFVSVPGSVKKSRVATVIVAGVPVSQFAFSRVESRPKSEEEISLGRLENIQLNLWNESR